MQVLEFSGFNFNFTSLHCPLAAKNLVQTVQISHIPSARAPFFYGQGDLLVINHIISSNSIIRKRKNVCNWNLFYTGICLPIFFISVAFHIETSHLICNVNTGSNVGPSEVFCKKK